MWLRRIQLGPGRNRSVAARFFHYLEIKSIAIEGHGLLQVRAAQRDMVEPFENHAGSEFTKADEGQGISDMPFSRF